MELDEVIDSVLDGPQACEECASASRLSNGLCLNCLFSGALDPEAIASGRAMFNEALAALKFPKSKWHIGDHEILDEVARGGMGVIYRARELHSGRIVALKRVLGYQGDADQALARFRREAETAARLDHPNIVPIYRLGEDADGYPFFTMKYAGGGSLAQARDQLRQDPRHSALLMKKVAHAVQYAHEQGVLHRDLKPGNILLDGRGEPLVSDFGLARCAEISSQLTRSWTSLGTPGYIAPEQADGPVGRLTPAADIYSLGAILFELLSGRPPFLGENAFGVMRQAAETRAPKLRAIVRHLDRDLETICARCLEREPSARYHSAGSLAKDLENWLEGRPIATRRVSPWLGFPRWVRANRNLAVSLAALFVLSAALFGWQTHAWKLKSATRGSIMASRSVVVMPFLDLDNAASVPMLSHSLAASLQSQLSVFGPALVKTASPALGGGSIDDVRKAAQETNARTMLSGTVRTVHGKKRISFRLSDAATGELLFTHRWEDNGQRDRTTPIDENIARAIYAILTAKDWSTIMQPKSDPGLRNNITREAILAGRELMFRYTASDLERAVELFKKATEIEPNSGLAQSYLASGLTAKTHYIPDKASLIVAKNAARKAVEIAPESTDAHRALAGVLYREGRFQQVLEELLSTAETHGTDDKLDRFIAMTLDTLGYPEQALPWYDRARRSTNRPGEVEVGTGDAWTKLGADERAMQAYRRAEELQAGLSRARAAIARLRFFQGDFDAARQDYQLARSSDELGDGTRIGAQAEFFARNFEMAAELYSELSEREPNGGGSFYGAVEYQAALARSLQKLGRAAEAKQILMRCLQTERETVEQQPENPEAVYRLAAVESSLGLTDSALQHLKSAVKLGWIDYRSLQMDPRFDSLHETEQFLKLVHEITSQVAEKRRKAESLAGTP